MPCWIHVKIKESAFAVVVETAKDALAKLAELTEVGHSEIAARDMSGAMIGLTTLQAEADEVPSGQT
jgi:hypothetical protein